MEAEAKRVHVATALAYAPVPARAPAYAPTPAVATTPTAPAVKYLRLILNRRLLLDSGEEGHMTFLYFGKVAVDLVLVARVLKGLPAFSLTLHAPEKVGTNLDIDAICYSINGGGEAVDTLRACLARVLGPEIERQNYFPYKPHVTNLSLDQVEKQELQSFRVLGVESNDGGCAWRMLFSS